MNIDEIPFKGLIYEMQAFAEDHSRKMFRQKIIRIYIKCLKSNRVLLAARIAEKYRSELTDTLRSDLSVAANYALFVQSLNKQ